MASPPVLVAVPWPALFGAGAGVLLLLLGVAAALSAADEMARAARWPG